ncbi:MAG: helix-hairpin-helix domain-containing protein, partial [Planctomycetota bacterium]
MPKSQEIIARYEGDRVTFDNADGSVMTIGNAWIAGDVVGVKGTTDRDELRVGQTYRFFGSWTTYLNKRTGIQEKQFAFRSFVTHVPHDPDGLANYLAAAGRGNSIGPAKAIKLVQHFGVYDVLERCRESSEEVSRVAKIPADHAERFAAVLREQQATENATLEVDRILSSNGFAKSLPRRVINTWGNQAANEITSNPFALMDFAGVGFRLADKLWVNLQKDLRDIQRQMYCMWHLMASDSEGHTWFRAAEIGGQLRNQIGSASPADAIR